MPLIRKPPSEPPAAAARAPDAAAGARALQHGTDDERWSAARAAAELEIGVPTLVEALTRERVPAVREALFSALVSIASPQSVAAILPFLRSEDATVRTEASDAVLAVKDAAWPHVPALLRDENPDVRILACGFARDMPRQAAVSLYCDLLDADPEANVCAAVAEALAEIGDAAALPALLRCAERFRATPFVAYSLGVAIDRIRSQA
ncbi:MAG TPA: HEAT repeat domain-containing protein [Gammaproteobacteria bacterium]|nr:HEAT repeat domain-containing protein [Gammaproteobacteria bacterium]